MYSDLRKLRKEKGLTVKQLAELSGITEEKIREIENGIFPEMDAFVQMAKEQGVEPVELFRQQCEENPCANCPDMSATESEDE